jgi:UDP-N-acetylmuramyl pentapeptide phosphotransferase/UDP-N-acetylglucosamine-1-phosphate transferase
VSGHRTTSGGPSAGALPVGALTAGVVGAAWTALSRRSTPHERWQRRNFRDREVTLLLGPAVGIGALAGVIAAGPRGRNAALLAVGGAAAIGGYDDLYGDSHARGLGGHARALREGRVTTGMVKLVSLVAAAAVGSGSRHRQFVDAALGTVLVAGGANLINLFDLRPGRAAKVTLVAAAALGHAPDRQGRAVVAVAAGAALGALPADLAERGMLGDCGAGTLGALLGWSAAIGGSRRRRSLLAAALVGLTLASERVSFSAVIARQPALRALDQLGRQPA